MTEEISATEVHNGSRVSRPAAHKIAVGSAAGSATIVLVWATSTFTPVTIPTEVAQAITILASIVISLLVPDDMEAL